MIELLVVVFIIGLLLAIGIPTGMAIQRQVLRKSSLATVGLLESACHLYYKDTGSFPPIDDLNDPGVDSNELLVKHILGTPDPPGDQQPGLGIRQVQGGKLIGPYVEVEKMTVTDNVFKDSCGNTIYYYVYNGSAFGGTADYGPDDPTDYATKGGELLASDIMVITPGPNAIWEPYADNPDTDDIATFIPE